MIQEVHILQLLGIQEQSQMSIKWWHDIIWLTLRMMANELDINKEIQSNGWAAEAAKDHIVLRFHLGLSIQSQFSWLHSMIQKQIVRASSGSSHHQSPERFVWKVQDQNHSDPLFIWQIVIYKELVVWRVGRQ
jgi:hypothetical protein